MSRPKRRDLIAKAISTQETELDCLLEEYESWLEVLPENLQESALADKLQTTIDELEEVRSSLEDARDSLESIDLPRGFGRD